MHNKYILLLFAAATLTSHFSKAQSLFDYFSGHGLSLQDSRENEKAVEFDYDIDFNYFFDNREFKASFDMFMDSDAFNIARFSPSFGVRASQGRNLTHRLMAGVNLTKGLGENPITDKTFSQGEDDPGLINSKLFKEIFYYYNMEARLNSGLLELVAGVYPRNMMKGEYGRAFFSDYVMMFDPEMEGVLVQFNTPRLFAEAGYDWLGQRGLDRYERYMVHSAGSYQITDWVSAGWAASYMHIGDSYIFTCDADDILFNPYAKADFGHQMGLQEISVKAGVLASMQADWTVETSPHFPVGGEGIVTVRNWDAGIENTLFFGDNLMPFKSSVYSDSGISSYYTDLLYLSEPFYFTRRGYASGYDRLELFYEPKISDALSLKLSAVGHFIFPSSEVIGSFLGWQAKASLVFDLDAIRHPRSKVPGKTSSGRTDRTRNQSTGRISGIIL